MAACSKPPELRSIDSMDHSARGSLPGRSSHRPLRLAAANRSGLWLLRPGSDPRAEWSIESIDRNSGGFEHAAILTDLDGDGIDELYVANDDEGEVNRYVWVDGEPQRELLYTHPEGLSGFTWNIMPVPTVLIPAP